MAAGLVLVVGDPMIPPHYNLPTSTLSSSATGRPQLAVHN